ncbi:hypothetical protein TVAG_390780 [Trichomonas vaginalis G3]|uniref:Uncharacterized protein n=1 Tax=Trichomonas vaginalis (strain ATCC PRA-98 / G3) TaxID=412133 RepID=A2FDZ2_TRIV3|nr:hypothetical protein TVAGG3_0402260 [Trichomonas vaginalis G3]EAX96871.1 hypothetical protein TVAG_390780 [Trichomonas vaginalis G3]KAI5534789.1 hypothetical protein TVAGG3_0402260 [Trichomonas vaginalis G3]|eukprot:XP_001309801.1 hypothetical protein [Trichomonas vaginalis G3]
MLSEININLHAATDMLELATELIKKPSNVVFKIKNLESFVQKPELSETVKIRKNYSRLKITVDALEVLIKFYMQLSKQTDDQNILNVKYLSKQITSENYYTDFYSPITLELETVLSSILYNSEINIDTLQTKRTIKEQKAFAIQFLEQHKIDKNVIPYLLFTFQRMLFGLSYEQNSSENDKNHVETFSFLRDLADKDENYRRLFIPIHPEMQRVIDLFNELTFTSYPIDMAVCIDKAIRIFNGITAEMGVVDKLKIICVALSFSFLPDPYYIMDSILSILTSSEFPANIRDSNNIYVSACQFLQKPNWKENFVNKQEDITEQESAN